MVVGERQRRVQAWPRMDSQVFLHQHRLRICSPAPDVEKVPRGRPEQDGILGRCASHAEPHLVEDVCEGVGEDCRLAAGLLDLHSESRHHL
jgi:hypothetical protein